jgi:hypothetical protein
MVALEDTVNLSLAGKIDLALGPAPAPKPARRTQTPASRGIQASIRQRGTRQRLPLPFQGLMDEVRAAERG